ncbi:hypothetical protein ACHAWX_001754 [Stephanocyclus meneghinianus]
MPTNSLPSLVHAIGGSIGSALAILAFYPLERIRVELQSHSCDHVAEAAAVDDDDSTDGRGDASGNGQDENDSSVESGDTEDDMDADGHESFELVQYPNVELVDPTRSSDVCLEFSTMQPPKEMKGASIIVDDIRMKQDALTNKQETQPSLPKAKQPSHNANKTTSSESMLQCLLRLHSEKSLYKGSSHMTITLMISNFIFFYALQLTKRCLTYIHQQQQDRHPGHVHVETQKLQFLHHMFRNYVYPFLPRSKMATSFLSSSIAGTINVLLTNPLWVASLRIMESKMPIHSPTKNDGDDDPHAPPSSLWTVIRDIAHSEGVSQLWNGTWTSLLLVSNPIIQHFLYERMRSWLLGRRREHRRRDEEANAVRLLTLTPPEAFVFGALAKTVATVVTYPLQLAQVLLRLQTKRIGRCSNEDKDDANNLALKEPTYRGTIDCLCQQFTRGGIPALFHGMNAKLLQTVLTSALTFLTYEQTLVLVGRVYDALQ